MKQQWESVTPENIAEATDAAWFFAEVRRLYGFDVPGIDYDSDTEVDVEWPETSGTTK
jgi:enoyl-[acyl-carrier protein] reductase/trans-2-enoyl-CoA reductase (NAD+)